MFSLVEYLPKTNQKYQKDLSRLKSTLDHYVSQEFMKPPRTIRKKVVLSRSSTYARFLAHTSRSERPTPSSYFSLSRRTFPLSPWNSETLKDDTATGSTLLSRFLRVRWWLRNATLRLSSLVTYVYLVTGLMKDEYHSNNKTVVEINTILFGII